MLQIIIYGDTSLDLQLRLRLIADPAKTLWQALLEETADLVDLNAAILMLSMHTASITVA